MQKFILPLFLLLMFILESLFSSVIPTDLFKKDTIAAPHFLFAVLVFITIYYNSGKGIYFALIFGFLFDMVYTELIGIYLFAYPILVYIVFNAMRILQINVFIVSILVLLGTTALEYYVYGFLSLLGRAHLSLGLFTMQRLLPTLLLNLIFLILFCIPLRKYLLKLLAVTEEK
jgi:rod shape-determining protein MreD